eukprot:GHVU01009513.1.p2 GENE.GHVU01009513.1~~GHVU01009513.1.p2  ORF type:complete len:129 (+),score=23.96 GHVU01009513.1:541-927(+)
MGAWLMNVTPTDVILLACAAIMTAMKVGEWKRAREGDGRTDRAKIDLVRAQLQLEIEQKTREAKHAAVDAANVEIGKLVLRFEKAGERTSTLASMVQAMPTRAEHQSMEQAIVDLYDRLSTVERRRSK